MLYDSEGFTGGVFVKRYLEFGDPKWQRLCL